MNLKSPSLDEKSRPPLEKMETSMTQLPSLPHPPIPVPNVCQTSNITKNGLVCSDSKPFCSYCLLAAERGGDINFGKNNEQWSKCFMEEKDSLQHKSNNNFCGNVGNPRVDCNDELSRTCGMNCSLVKKLQQINTK